MRSTKARPVGSPRSRTSGRRWQTHVLDELSFQQREYVERAGHSRLDQFDLAALLRIADRNWSEVARAGSLAPEARNWLKEAQSIRNRWAHAPAAGIPDDARYRDLDTIERLMQALGAETAALAEIRADRSALLARLAGIAGTTGGAPGSAQTEGAGQDAFQPGQMVRLKARPATTGVIVARLASDAEDRYQVFHDGDLSTYYASQIEPAAPPEPRPSVLPAVLHAALTALQLRHPSTGHLYSLFAARVNFVPYQFRPVVKLIQADRPRLLIADEVGVGKTIEAGLILKELRARGALRSVLVICPRPLVAERKWLGEMAPCRRAARRMRKAGFDARASRAATFRGATSLRPPSGILAPQTHPCPWGQKKVDERPRFLANH